MPKKAIWQRNMSAMEVRDDFLEADGTELKARSLRSARNMRALATGGVEVRPGTLFLREGEGIQQLVEVTPKDGFSCLVSIEVGRLRVLSQAGESLFAVSPAPWADGSNVWVVPQRERIVIGAPGVGLYLLEYRRDEWAFGDYGFVGGPGDALQQPYWNFERGVTLAVSETTGDVTLTFSGPVLTPDHVGLRLRYLGREIILTDYLEGSGGTLGEGTVVSKLPPSFALTLDTTANLRVKDVVTQDSSGFEGIVTRIVSGTVVRVATQENFDGPDVGGDSTERLRFPSGSAEVTAKTPIAPQPVEVWDEPLFSAARGWPRTGCLVGGRLALADFPQAQNVVALSAAGTTDDFGVGVEDDDAIVRSVTDGTRIRHVIDAGDLIILADRGSYVAPARNGEGITPATFRASLFDERGANGVRPVYVNDAVLFVDSGGRNIVAAVLDGSSNLRWTARFLSTFHADIIKSPVGLCGPAASSSAPEKYAFVVNADGTLAAISWLEGLGAEGIGFAPWDTPDGVILHVAPAFGTHVLIADRTLGETTSRFLETFGSGIYLDCSVRGLPRESALASHLRGLEVAVCWSERDQGDGIVASDGSVPGFEHVTSNAQVGLNFIAEASPWPAEVESARTGTFTARVIRFMVSVRESGPFVIRCNGDNRRVGGYEFGDVLASPAPLLTDVRRASVFGRRTHPDLAVVRDRPGPLRILALGQEVQA